MSTTLPLSRRELEIAKMAVSGDSAVAIATRLSLSLRTIETQLQIIYAKLGIREGGELAEALARLSP